MLKGDEGALIAAAVAGRPLGDIAAVAGVSIATAKRRLADRDIRAAIQEGRSRHRREAVGQLNGQLTSAIARLSELVSHDDPNVAIRAVGMVLGSAHKFVLAVEFDERLRDLELQRGSNSD